MDIKKSFTVSQPILMKHWPKIAEQIMRNTCDAHDLVSAGRQAYFDRIDMSKVANVQPPKSAPSRFLSLNHAQDWFANMM